MLSSVGSSPGKPDQSNRCTSRTRTADAGRSAFRRTSQTAHSLRQHSGWLLVTYPFHPLSGRSLEILYSKRCGGGCVFVCDAGDGSSVTLAIEWTDRGPAAD